VSWSNPTTYDAAALSTQGTTLIDPFVPTARADWQDLTVIIPAPFQSSGTFKIRFQMVNGSTPGNFFYLDNLRVGTGVLATKPAALASRGIGVFPNPLTTETAVHLNLATSTQVQVYLTDVMGRSVLTLPAKTYGAGQQTVSLQAAERSLRAGVYVVHIALDGETFTSKLVIE
jgi:hypothetical protein